MNRLAYILAASHSGSTMLAMLLGAHEQVCTVGEIKMGSLGDVERYRCSCGQFIQACGFWQGVCESMNQRGMPLRIGDGSTDFMAGATGYTRRLLRPLHRGPVAEFVRDTGLALSPSWRAKLAETQRRNVALIECICGRTGSQVVVDSSKTGVRLKYLLRNPQLDVRVIRLIRDGRAVAMTYMNPAEFADASDPKLRCGGTGGDWASERLSMTDAAREWRRSNEEAEAVLSRLDPARWMTVRYEDLCTRTDSNLAELHRFLGVDARASAKSFRAVEQHVLGNGMRLDTTAEVRLDERWKSVLTAEDLHVFDRVAGDLNRRYGYQ